ncbi:MAG: hypothetical protein FWC62_02830 [Firmicutes bacterium]|nr:hypothetical protein [Bacillota bacterium]
MARPDKYQYARPVYGSAAPDFAAVPMPEPRYVEPDVELPGIHAQPKRGERARVRPAVRTKQAVAPMAILGYLLVGVLMVFALLSQIRLSGISDESAKLQAQLNTLQTEHARLLVNYENTFNFTEIETYAVNVLGMQEPQQGQIFYLQTSAPDKTVILTPPEDGGGLLNRISDAFSSLGEYLK